MDTAARLQLNQLYEKFRDIDRNRIDECFEDNKFVRFFFFGIIWWKRCLEFFGEYLVHLDSFFGEHICTLVKEEGGREEIMRHRGKTDGHRLYCLFHIPLG